MQGCRLSLRWIVLFVVAISVVLVCTEGSWAQEAAQTLTADAKANELLEGELASVIARFTYAAIIGVLLLCGLGLPLPEEVPILTSAILAASGTLEPWPALAALMFGVMAGDSAMFWLGKRWGAQVLEHRMARRMLTPERVVMIAAYFKKYGAWIIFAARFLPGLRAPLFLTSGSMKVRFWVFFAMDGAAALLSIPTSFWLAYYFTDRLESVLKVKDTVQYWAFGALVVFVGSGLLVKYLWKKRRAVQTAVEGQPTVPTDNPASVPSNEVDRRVV